MRRTEILISGFGGQGVVKLGQILGLAAVRQGLRASMLKSHGTETRGGYVRSQVVLSDEPIDSPLVENPDYFCALSSAAYARFSPLVKQGLIIYDPAFVSPSDRLPVRQVPFPAKDIAVKEFQNEVFANTVLLGGLVRLMEGLLREDCVISAMWECLPRFKEENKRAFELGFRFGEGAGKS